MHFTLFPRPLSSTDYMHYATLPTTSAATPSSSLRASIFIVTPVLALNAMRTMAATLPPVIVFPYNLSVCVEVDSATSVPSRGWRERVLVSCSVASTNRQVSLCFENNRLE
jgi:hypothetical protein